MKTNIIPVIAISLSVSMVSCQRIMDPGDDTESIIYVECIQGLSDTTAINVMATAPKFGYGKSYSLGDADVSLKVGGREIPLVRDDVQTVMFPKGSFHTTEKINPGEKMEVHVSAQGFKAVSATTVKPSEVKPFKSEAMKDVIYGDEYGLGDGSMDVVRMDITPDDPDMKDRYYMLRFDLLTESQGKKYSSHPSPILKGGFYLSDFGDPDVVVANLSKWSIFTPNSYFAGAEINPAYLYKGSTIANEGKIKIYFRYGNSMDGAQIRATLMYVSPEFYRYAKSIEYNTEDNDELAIFFPSSYAYSNVKGGCGVLGAVSGREGEWITIK